MTSLVQMTASLGTLAPASLQVVHVPLFLHLGEQGNELRVVKYESVALLEHQLLRAFVALAAAALRPPFRFQLAHLLHAYMELQQDLLLNDQVRTAQLLLPLFVDELELDFLQVVRFDQNDLALRNQGLEWFEADLDDGTV